MATLKITLDTRRVKNDGTYPIVIRIALGTRFKDFPTGISCKKQMWNSSSAELKKGYLNHQQVNLQLRELQQHYQLKLLFLYRNMPGGFNFDDFKKLISEEDKNKISVREFWQNEITQLLASKKYGNARNHKIAFDKLCKVSCLDISFEEINFTLLKSIEAILSGSGLKPNTISVYLRALRAIYNIAINKEVVDISHYPFRRFKIISEKTVPHVLNADVMRKFFNLNLDQSHPLHKAWLMGKLTFLLGGINFIDLILLTRDNIKEGRVIYKRSKTKKIYSILFLPETKAIINLLLENSTNSICGVLNKQELESGFKLAYTIRDKNKQFNKKLAQLSKLIDSDTNIRSYTFRYTIANMCKQMGYEIPLISELLGHSYGSSITMGYLEAYDKKRLDEMLVHVCNSVMT